MRAHQIMSQNAIIMRPETPILAAQKMIENHAIGLPVPDASGRLAGVASEGDILRRSESAPRKNDRVGLSTSSAHVVLPLTSEKNGIKCLQVLPSPPHGMRGASSRWSTPTAS